MFDLFGGYYVTRFIEVASKLPKEALYAGAVYFVITDVHKRNSEVKIAKINAEIAVAKLEVEALKIKRDLQRHGTKIHSV